MTELNEETRTDVLAAPRRLLDEGEPELARRELALQVAQQPENAEAWYLLGVADFRLGRFEAAVDQFSEAARLKPADHRVHHGLGRALEQLGRHDEATRAYHIAEALNPAAVSPGHAPAAPPSKAPPAAAAPPPPAPAIPPQPADAAQETAAAASPPLPLTKMLGFGQWLTGDTAVKVQGVVEGAEVRMEHKPGLTPPQLYVMNYVLHTTDKHRRKFPLVAVEMRGAEMQGRLHDGEEIVLNGKISQARNIILGTKATKTATGEVFQLTGRPHRSAGSILHIITKQVIPWIVFLAIAGTILAAILSG